MGTSSMIGRVNEDGSVTTSYCHYDGYLAYMGKMLEDHYNTPARAKAVANVGYLSSLTENLEWSVEHSADVDDHVVYESIDAFLTHGYNFCSAKFLYLFSGDSWFFAEDGRYKKCLQSLKDEAEAAYELYTKNVAKLTKEY